MNVCFILRFLQILYCFFNSFSLFTNFLWFTCLIFFLGPDVIEGNTTVEVGKYIQFQVKGSGLLETDSILLISNHLKNNSEEPSVCGEEDVEFYQYLLKGYDRPTVQDGTETFLMFFVSRSIKSLKVCWCGASNCSTPKQYLTFVASVNTIGENYFIYAHISLC